MKRRIGFCLFGLGVCTSLIQVDVCFGQETKAAQTSAAASPKERTVARLFWQDTGANTVKWGNLIRTGDEWRLAPQSLEGFPKLDLDQQSLVQMESIDDVLLVGIHDTDKGAIQSGWVAFKSGVTKEEHGDHFHWHYDDAPAIVAQRLDKEQGNPAHVYQYNQQFVIANDSLNGFTIVDPQAVRSNRSDAARFYSGGGNHITLAAPSREIVYATWADRDGENVGRVDVVGVGEFAKQKGYSFRLPTGGLHGATANANRVFFAPSDGIVATVVDAKLQAPPSNDSLEYVSLGKDAKSDRPNRTGAFVNHREYVLFTFGSGAEARMGMINAKDSRLSLKTLTIPAEEGLALTTPKTTITRNGKEYAFVVRDRRQSEAQESVAVVDLDPNGDKKLDDAKVVQSIDLGPSKIEGHSGHHEVCFLPQSRMACISNPGDGTIWLISLVDFTVQAKLAVGGTPGRLIGQ